MQDPPIGWIASSDTTYCCASGDVIRCATDCASSCRPGVMAGSLCRHIAISTALAAALLTCRAQSQGVKIELEGIVPISCKLETRTTQITLGDIASTGSKNIPF